MWPFFEEILLAIGIILIINQACIVITDIVERITDKHMGL